MTNINVLYAVAAIDALSFSTLITTLTQYVYSLEGTPFFLGTIGSICALIGLIWNPIAGSLSDQIGRKKVLLNCLFICTVANLILVVFNSLTAIFVSRILAALGTPIMVLVRALIDDTLQQEHEKISAIHKIQALGGGCFIFGALIGGFLTEYGNMTTIFTLATLMFATNFVLIYLTVNNETRKKPKHKHEINKFKQAINNLKNLNWPKYWDVFLIKLSIDFAFLIFQSNIGYVLNEFGVKGKTLGYIFASMSIMGILMSLSMKKINKLFYSDDKTGLKRLQHGMLVLIMGYLSLSRVTAYYIYLIHLGPFIMVRVLLENTTNEILLKRTVPSDKGSVLSTFDSTMSLAGLVSPLSGGYVTETWGPSYCWYLAATPLILAVTLTFK